MEVALPQLLSDPVLFFLFAPLSENTLHVYFLNVLVPLPHGMSPMGWQKPEYV